MLRALPDVFLCRNKICGGAYIYVSCTLAYRAPKASPLLQAATVFNLCHATFSRYWVSYFPEGLPQARTSFCGAASPHNTVETPVGRSARTCTYLRRVFRTTASSRLLTLSSPTLSHHLVQAAPRGIRLLRSIPPRGLYPFVQCHDVFL